MKFVLLMSVFLVVTGCGQGNEEGAPPADNAQTVAATDTDDAWAPVSATAGGPKTEFADPEALTHPQGRFRVRWPANCVKVHSLIEESESTPGQYDMVRATGHIDGDPECGYFVWAWFNEPDGVAATPERVTARMAAIVASRKLTIVSQGPIKRLGMEGVVAYCREERTGLIYWIEAYLSLGRTLMLAAWERGDYMFEDEEILRFFRSVEFVD